MKAYLLISLLLIGQTAYSAMLEEEQSWEFMLSVGGISIGEPKRTNSHWILPVNCNVAGLQEVTVKPTMLNSGLVWAGTETQVEENIIFITIQTALVGMGGGSSDCGSARLGKIKSGTYKVMYRGQNQEAHLLGEVRIESSQDISF